MNPAPIFYNHLTAFANKHIPQSTSSTDICYDVISMLDDLEGYNIYWASDSAASVKGHLHVHLFEKKIYSNQNHLPIEDKKRYPQEAIAKNAFGEDVVYVVRDYPTKDKPVTAFMVAGYANEDRHLIAKRLFDVESVIRKRGFEVDKMFVKEKRGGKIKIYVYPRSKGYADEFCGLQKRLLGPVEMSGIFVIPDVDYFGLGAKKAVDVLNEIGVPASASFGSDFVAMNKAIKRQMRPGKDVIKTGERSSKGVKAIVFDLDGVLSQETLNTLRKAQIGIYAEIMNTTPGEVWDEAMEFYTSNDGTSSRKLIPEIMKKALSKDKSRKLRTAEEYYASYSDRRELDFQRLLDVGEGLLSPSGIQLLETMADLPEPPQFYLASSRGREDVLEFVKKTGLIRYIGEDHIFANPEQQSSLLRGQVKKSAVDEIRKTMGLSAEEVVFIDDAITVKGVLGDSAISVIVVNDYSGYTEVAQKCSEAKIDYVVTSLEPTAEFLGVLLGRDDIEIQLKDRALRVAVRSAANAYRREQDGIKAQLLSNGREVTYRQMIENVLRPKLEAAVATEKGKLDIAIIGDAATGKTTTANMIMSADIKSISGMQPAVISTDRFLTDRSERLIDAGTGKPTEDLLSKFTFEEMMERFKAHLRGEPIKVPVYDETFRSRMRIGMAENGKPVLLVGDNRLVLEECWQGQRSYFGETLIETRESSNDRIVLAINGTDNVINLAGGRIASVEVDGERQPVKRRKEMQKWPSPRYEVERCGEVFEYEGDFVEAVQVIRPGSRLFITDGMLSLHDKDGYFDDKYDLKLIFTCHPDVVFERARRRFVARRSASAQTAIDKSQMRLAEKEFMKLLAVREHTEKEKYIQKDVDREGNKDIVAVNTQSVAESIYALYKEGKLREHEDALKRIFGNNATAGALEKELDEIAERTKADIGEDTEELAVEGRTIVVDWTQKEINKKQIAHVERMVFKEHIKKLLALLSDIRMSDNDGSAAELTAPYLYWSRLFLDTMPFYESRLRRIIERAHRDILADPAILTEREKPSDFLDHISEELHERSPASRDTLTPQELMIWRAYIKALKGLHTDENQSIFSGLIRRLKHLEKGKAMLCVCPMSESIVRAYFRVAVEQGLVPTFIASPRQVDVDGSYTGWNQKAFVKFLNKTAAEMKYEGTMLIERDHGGPRQNPKYGELDIADTMKRAKITYRADIDAGFDILDIDCSLIGKDKSGQPVTPPVTPDDIAKYTAELIADCESHCTKRGIPPVAYEISYDDPADPVSEPEKLEAFIVSLRKDLDGRGLGHVWNNIVYLVVDTGARLQGGGQVGRFDADTARKCADIAEKYGLVLKQHESDYLSADDLRKIAAAGVVGVNIGPEFSRAEYEALKALEDKVNQRIAALGESAGEEPSDLMITVERRLAASPRWKRWFEGVDTFDQLTAAQKEAACLECGRYVQGEYDVVKARKRLYYLAKKIGVEDDPEKFVTDAIGKRILRFVDALGCKGIRQDFYDVSLRRSAILKDIMKMPQADVMKEITIDDIRSHTERVARIAASIAKEMGLPAADIDVLQRAIWVHDIAQLDKSKYPAALRAINEAMHRLPEDERVEPSAKYLDEWIKHKAASYNVPAEQIEEAIEKAEKGDRYPIWWLYTLYVALKGRIPAYIFEKDAEKVAAIIYDHGAEATRKLRELNMPVKENDPVALLFTYHHDYHQLDVKLQEMTELGEISREAADRLRLLEGIFIISDGFEQGNNSVRLVEMRKMARVEHFYETINGWLRKREKREGITDHRPVEALERLIGKRDKELFRVIAEARNDHKLMPQDEAYIEYLSHNLPKSGSTILPAVEPVLTTAAAGGILAWLGGQISEHPALATLILGIVAVTAIVVIWRKYFPLWWHVWRMYSGTPAERLSSARALGEMKDPRAAKALINELTSDVDEKNLITTRLALVDIGSPTVPALIKALGHDSKFLNRVARTLLEINDPRLSFMADYLRQTANKWDGYSEGLGEGDVAYLLDHLGSGIMRSVPFIPSINREAQADRQKSSNGKTLLSIEPFSILFLVASMAVPPRAPVFARWPTSIKDDGPLWVPVLAVGFAIGVIGLGYLILRIWAGRSLRKDTDKAANGGVTGPKVEPAPAAEKVEPRPAAQAAPSAVIGIPSHSPDKLIAAIKESLGEDARVVTAPDRDKFSSVMNSKNAAGVWVDESVTIDMIKGGKLKEAAESALRAKFVAENRPLILSLNEFSIKDKTRRELVSILKLIAANLGKPGKADIDTDIQSNLPPDNTVFLDKAKALVEARKREIARVYNELPMPRAYARDMAIATTERAAEDDPFTADNMAKAQEKGIANVFIYGDRFKKPEEAQRFMKACGYTKDISTIRFINKNDFASYQSLLEGIAAAIFKDTGTAVAFDDIGIRAAEGELLKAGEKPTAGRFLEIPLVNVNGIEVCAALNSYQILVSLVTRLKEPGIALEAVSIPDVSYDKAKGIFKYLPRSLPIDYGVEIETYRNAVRALSTAA